MSQQQTQIVDVDALSFHLGRRGELASITTSRARLHWIETQRSQLRMALKLMDDLFHEQSQKHYELEVAAREHMQQHVETDQLGVDS